MVRHNNMISNGHFHKKWQRQIKFWFDQPMKKNRRKKIRIMKLNRMAPRPRKFIRPSVNCPSLRYNTKIRAGRGFTSQELKLSGINKNFARTIGIAVDRRRRNRCYESIIRNVQRLKEYKTRLIVLPKKFKEIIKFDDGKNLNKIKLGVEKIRGRKVTDKERTFEAFVTLRRARSDAKYSSLRVRKKFAKKEALEAKN